MGGRVAVRKINVEMVMVGKETNTNFESASKWQPGTGTASSTGVYWRKYYQLKVHLDKTVLQILKTMHDHEQKSYDKIVMPN